MYMYVCMYVSMYVLKFIKNSYGGVAPPVDRYAKRFLSFFCVYFSRIKKGESPRVKNVKLKSE